MKISRIILAPIIICLSLQSSFALGLDDKKKSLPRLEAGMGIGAVNLPDYRGSDESEKRLFPIPYIIYRGDKLRVDRRGIRGLIYESGNTAINISGDFGLPVNSEKNRARSGMPDLDFAFHIGPSFEYLINDDPQAKSTTIFKFPVQLVLATDFTNLHSEGVFIYPHIKYIKNAALDFSLSVGATFANQKFHDYYYGVASPFSTAARPTYTASSGFSGLRLSMTLSKRIKNYWLGGFMRYENLNKVAFDDSPLLKRNHSLIIGFGASWIFYTVK